MVSVDIHSLYIKIYSSKKNYNMIQIFQNNLKTNFRRIDHANPDFRRLNRLVRNLNAYNLN